MAVSNVLGRAYIEIHADAAPFAKDLERDIQAVADSPKIKQSSQSTGETISDNVVKGAKKKLEKEGPSILAKFRETLSKNTNKDHNLFQRIGQAAGGAVADGVSQGFSSASKGAVGLFSSIGSSLGNVGSAGPFGAVIGILITAGIPALIGLVLVLVQQLGALVNVVGLLPGGLAILAAGIVPVVIGFNGFGEALGAIASHDPKKIADAMKALAPAARVVATEFQKMMPFFHQLQQAVQQALFSQFAGAITKVQKNLGPTFLSGFVSIAKAAGQFFNQLLWVFQQPAAAAFFKQLFAAATRVYEVFTPGLIRFIQGLMTIAGGAVPTLIDLFAGLGNVMTDFGNFLIAAVQSGDFKLFLDKFILALNKLIEFGKSSYNLITTILGGVNEQGQATFVFDLLIQVIDDLTAFFASDRGQQALKGLVFLAGTFALMLQWALDIVLRILAAIGDLVDLFHWILSKLGLVSSVVTGFTKIGGQTVGGARDRNFAEGGVVTGPNLGWTGEAGPEAIIPLTNPRRAQEVIDQAGLGSMVGGDTQVNVYIGDEQVMARVDKRVNQAFKQFGRNLNYGPRPIGANA